MPNLTIHIKNYSSLKPTIFIDDKEVKIKKKLGKQVCNVSCNATAKLRIENYHPLNQSFGLFICYFFFIVSLLGIFDVRYRSKEKRLLFSAELYLNEDSQLEILYNSFSKDNEAVQLQGDVAYNTFKNQYILDTVLKKKIKILKFLKIGTWILFLIIFAYSMYSLIF